MTKNFKFFKFLPLVKLPRGYYNVKSSSTNYNKYWSPWNFPSRKNKVLRGLLFFEYSNLPTTPYFSVYDESLKRPVIPEIVPTAIATVVNTFIPAFSLFFSSFGWATVGGHLCLRPTFLTKCQPDPSKINASPGQIYFTNDVCTGKLESTEFQGGHSATAFGGWVFFILYINGKSKPWTNGSYLWKILILCLPLLFASWISVTRINDFRHFPFQIITGAILGIFAGLISYRLYFGNSDWFIGNGNYLDHIPARYKFIEDWDDRDVDEERGGSRRGSVARETKDDFNKSTLVSFVDMIDLPKAKEGKVIWMVRFDFEL
ncbi:9347_t:CDS:2 [Entrophospora sp. SA101]|nr:5200_t:CDS:2 [Entrophospora sp. SA101]CAJ0836788.1 9347_t:CDS:2 [Entrophospora sp. SA101]CAJ0905874.1 875_t:CDS:2 [Entrophospora sp. SA101]CAJ0917934.1 11192_t:CDS:2 [Entrophospora sp. SA101]